MGVAGAPRKTLGIGSKARNKARPIAVIHEGKSLPQAYSGDTSKARTQARSVSSGGCSKVIPR